MKPMLAMSADLDTVGLFVNDDDWWVQQKLDGERFLVVVEDGVVSVLNRQGMPKSKNMSHKTLGAFEAFDKGLWVFDGEVVGTTVHLFDLVAGGDQVAPSDPLEDRLSALERTFQIWKPQNCDIELVHTARTEEDKALLINTAQERLAEGVMVKHRQGPYQPVRRSPYTLKLKFVKELDAIVTGLHHEGKDNAVLSLLDPENQRVVEVGRASTIGKKPTPEIGQVWLVRYLYCVDPNEPRLYQPRLMSMRTDKSYEECLLDQLVYTDKSVIERTRKEM